MSDRGRFSGFCWHEEYHTINRKKDKAADCIYLTEDRICRNRKCVQYGDKCFVATHCPYRIKEKKAENARKCGTHLKKVVSIECSIPGETSLYCDGYGEGKFVSFDNQYRVITVEFNGTIKHYQYPEAFWNGHIRAEENIKKLIKKDIKDAKWE